MAASRDVSGACIGLAALALTIACSSARGAEPPVAWQQVALPDGSGTILLPTGYRILSAQGGTAHIVGPAGEAVSLGYALQIFTLKGVTTVQGFRLDASVVAPYCEPAPAWLEVTRQLNQRLLKAGQTTDRLDALRVVEQAPVACRPGRAAYLHVSYRQNDQPYRGLALVITNPVDDAMWLYYISAVTAPEAVFARKLPLMVQVWQSWKVSDAVFLERTRQAITSMKECTRIVQEAIAARQKAGEKAATAWDSYIRGKTVIVDPRTGQEKEVASHESDKVIEALNREAGYERWKPAKLE